jgi:quinohemoprotein ethanol dehydrogenase
MRASLLASACLALMFAAGCGETEEKLTGPAAVNAKRIENADSEPGQWLTAGRNYEEQRFSPLAQITPETIGTLGLAWSADFDTNRGQEATPVVIDGVIYVSTAWSKVNAYDARTGNVIWEYDPEVPGEWGANACCDVVNRGVAAWRNKIYVGTIDGRLVALDAASGKPVWDVSTIDKNRPYTITGAPRVVKGKVIIGNGGAEYGVRGYVTAYDAETGAQAWRFYTAPNPNKQPDNAASDKIFAETANATWSDDGAWKQVGGGGTAWDAIVYDPKSDLVYIGTGNGSPWNSQIRSPGNGDNLFLTSIVALNPDTGEYVWHYQQTQRETWDYTATQPIMIADLRIDGVDRRVVMQAPKNGFFYVLDAKTGKLISAKPIIDVTWASGVDLVTGRAIENPEARFEVTGKPATVAPHAGGAHSWHPWSYSPQTGLVYIPAMDANMTYSPVANFEYSPVGTNTGVGFAGGRIGPAPAAGPPATPPKSDGMLLAWDPVAQKEVWRVPFGNRGRGGGTLATAGGLVFQGNSKNQEFAAYRATDGEKLWSMPVQTGIVAGPASFELDGEQYVAVTAGNNQSNYYSSNHSRLLVFKLGATAVLPEAQPALPPPPFDPPKETPGPEAVALGEAAYSRTCAGCHGVDARNGGNFPDLRRSAGLKDAAYFNAVVLDGALSDNGMGSFKEVLGENGAGEVRAYLIAQSQAALRNPALARGRTGPEDAPPPVANGPPVAAPQ